MQRALYDQSCLGDIAPGVFASNLDGTFGPLATSSPKMPNLSKNT